MRTVEEKSDAGWRKPDASSCAWSNERTCCFNLGSSAHASAIKRCRSTSVGRAFASLKTSMSLSALAILDCEELYLFHYSCDIRGRIPSKDFLPFKKQRHALFASPGKARRGRNSRAAPRWR